MLTPSGEVHQLRLDLSPEDTINNLISQVTVCLASLTHGFPFPSLSLSLSPPCLSLSSICTLPPASPPLNRDSFFPPIEKGLKWHPPKMMMNSERWTFEEDGPPLKKIDTVKKWMMPEGRRRPERMET